MLPPNTLTKISKNLDDSPESMGTFALRLYFFQLIASKNFSLDLRQGQFSFDEGWVFHGNRFAFAFSDTIQTALINTYKSYYEYGGKDLGVHLEQMKLIDSTWDPAIKKELEHIFIQHFKGADGQAQYFKVQELADSFKNVFMFIKKQGAIVPSEFSMLGIYLTSLYMTLESIGSPFDVKAAYLHAKEVSQEL